MSEWINCDIAKPPESHLVLLYIVEFLSLERDYGNHDILTGFYSEDTNEVGYYIAGFIEHKFFKETENVKVVAWTLLPRVPDRRIFKGSWSG